MEATDSTTVFDKQVFLDRVEFLIAHHCGGNQSKFNEIVGQRGAAYRWRKAEFFPKVDPLVRIAEHFGVSLDWLLGLTEDSKAGRVNGEDKPLQDKGSMAEQIELIDYYKNVAEHWRNLYRHMNSIVRELKSTPQKGVVGQIQAS